MYYKILFILLFLSTSSYGQELKEKLAKDVCQCLNEAEEIDLKTFTACFSSNMMNYQEEIEKLIDKNSTLSEYEQGRIWGQKLFFEMQASLIHNCDAYYNLFQRLRTESILSMKKRYTQQVIDSIDRVLAENKSIELMMERGNAYFVKDQFKEAKEQYYECLGLNPDNAQSYFFLGWVEEAQGNYQEAIELYEKAFKSTERQEILIFVELVKRKATE
jgi:tetratricopeptide (TPR) repeat protein